MEFYNWGAPAVPLQNKTIVDDGSNIIDFYMPIADAAEQPKAQLPRVFRHQHPSYDAANYTYDNAQAYTGDQSCYTSFSLSFGGTA